MTRQFEKAYITAIRNEGGYANNPLDRGGETYCGISRRFHPNWSGWKHIDARKKSRPIKSNELLPELADLVLQFYYDVFWVPNRCQEMSQELSITVFDMTINHGSGKAIELLQRSLNAANRNQKLWDDIEVDGLPGDQTSGAIAAAMNKRKSDQVNTWLNCLRGAFFVQIMEGDHTQEEFATSWASRIRIEREEA